MPFISPNEAPFLVTHSLPLDPSVTYGMRSRNAALALLVKRSGGSQIKSTWQSAEITSYFMFYPPYDPGSSMPCQSGMRD